MQRGADTIMPNWVLDAAETLPLASDIKVLIFLQRNRAYRLNMFTTKQIGIALEIDLRTVSASVARLLQDGYIMSASGKHTASIMSTKVPQGHYKYTHNSSENSASETAENDPLNKGIKEERNKRREEEEIRERSHSRGENFSNDSLESPKNPEAPSFSPKILEGVKSPLVSFQAKTPPQAILEPKAANQEYFFGGGAGGVDSFVENSRGGGLDCKNPYQAENLSFSPKILEGVKSPLVSFQAKTPPQAILEPKAANQEDFFGGGAGGVDSFVENSRGGGLDCKNPHQAENSSQFLMAVFGLNLLRQMLSEPSAANVTRADWYSLSQNRLNQLLEQAKFDAADHGIAVQTAMKKRLDDAVKRPGERKPRRDLSGNVSGGSPYADLEAPKTPEASDLEAENFIPVVIPKIVNGKKVIPNAANENAFN